VIEREKQREKERIMKDSKRNGESSSSSNRNGNNNNNNNNMLVIELSLLSFEILKLEDKLGRLRLFLNSVKRFLGPMAFQKKKEDFEALKSKIQKIKSRQIELVFLIVVYFWRR
jgi:hypothetical protein